MKGALLIIFCVDNDWGSNIKDSYSRRSKPFDWCKGIGPGGEASFKTFRISHAIYINWMAVAIGITLYFIFAVDAYWRRKGIYRVLGGKPAPACDVFSTQLAIGLPLGVFADGHIFLSFFSGWHQASCDWNPLPVSIRAGLCYYHFRAGNSQLCWLWFLRRCFPPATNGTWMNNDTGNCWQSKNQCLS